MRLLEQSDWDENAEKNHIRVDENLREASLDSEKAEDEMRK